MKFEKLFLRSTNAEEEPAQKMHANCQLQGNQMIIRGNDDDDGDEGGGGDSDDKNNNNDSRQHVTPHANKGAAATYCCMQV